MRITAQNLMNIKPQLADFLSNLEVGDSVRGRIMELLGESISIKTASGQLFTAALMTDAELKTGQTIELVINSITEDGVFAELKTEPQKQAKVTEDVKLQQVLKQLDIKPEENNIQAAKLLVKYNMPVTKENVLQLASTQKSIEAFAQGDIVKAFALMQSEQDIYNTGFIKLAKQTVLLEKQGEHGFRVLQQNVSQDTTDSNVEPQKPAINNVNRELKQELVAERQSSEVQRQSITDKQAMVESTIKQPLKQLIDMVETEEMQKSAPKIEKLIDTVVKLFETASKVKPEHSAYLISKDIEVTPSAVKALVDNVGSQGKLDAKLQDLEKLTQVLEEHKADVREIKQDIKKLFLKPEVLQDKEQVQESIKEILKTCSKLESLIKEHGFEDKVDRTALSDIKSNMDFIKNVNSNINYIQIPLLINENKTTAEIFVLGNKKKRKSINPESAFILIALDLKSLGHIESLIGVDKKSVNITFKVEKDELKKLISGSTDSLKLALEARGYSLRPVQIIDITERFNLLELEEIISAKPNKMHLDIKV